MPRYADDGYTRYEWPSDEFTKILSEVRASEDEGKELHTTRLTSKGQLVIPASIRRRYQMEKGTEVRIEEREDGLLLRPITEQSIRSVRGILEGLDLPDRIEKEVDREIE